MKTNNFELYKEAFHILIKTYLIIDDNNLTRKQKIKEIEKVRIIYQEYIRKEINILSVLNKIISFFRFFNKSKIILSSE